MFIKKVNILGILGLLFVIVFSFFVYLFLNFQYPNVQKNQVWVRVYNNDDPFEEIRIDTIKILEIKDNYCKYIVNDTIKHGTKFSTVLHAKLIKDSNIK